MVQKMGRIARQARSIPVPVLTPNDAATVISSSSNLEKSKPSSSLNLEKSEPSSGSNLEKFEPSSSLNLKKLDLNLEDLHKHDQEKEERKTLLDLVLGPATLKNMNSDENPNSFTLETLSETSTIHLDQSSLYSKFLILDPELSTLDPELSTLDPEISTLDPELSTLDPEISTLDPEISEELGNRLSEILGLERIKDAKIDNLQRKGNPEGSDSYSEKLDSVDNEGSENINNLILDQGLKATDANKLDHLNTRQDELSEPEIYSEPKLLSGINSKSETKIKSATEVKSEGQIKSKTEPVLDLDSKSRGVVEAEEDDYDYSDLVDYGLEAEDEVGGDVLAGLVEDEYEYYEYDIVTGFIKVPQNYSGLQFNGLTEIPRPWNARTAFLEQVAAKIYMVVPAVIGGILLGILFWLITVFIIRSYGVIKKKIFGDIDARKRKEEETIQGLQMYPTYSLRAMGEDKIDINLVDGNVQNLEENGHQFLPKIFIPESGNRLDNSVFRKEDEGFQGSNEKEQFVQVHLEQSSHEQSTEFCVGEEEGEDEEGESIESGSRTTESASSGIGMSEKDSDLNISKMSAVSDIVKTTVKLQKENGTFFKGSFSSQSNLSKGKTEEAENRRFSD